MVGQQIHLVGESGHLDIFLKEQIQVNIHKDTQLLRYFILTLTLIF